MIVTVFKYLKHCRKQVYAHKFDSKILFIYVNIYSSLPCNFRLNILLNVENIAKTILVALEVSISILRKVHSVCLKKNYGLSKFLLWSLLKIDL